MSKHYRKETDCLNCGANVFGHFCPICGQENLNLQEPFWHFLSHSIGHYFHFDTKFFNTIIPLITKPGQLTIDYIEGKRTRYLQPISMFIFISIVYFLFIPFLNLKEKKENVSNNTMVVKDITLPSDFKKDLSKLPDFLQKISEDKIREAQINYFKTLKKERQNQILDSLKMIGAKQKNPAELNSFIDDLSKAKNEPVTKEKKEEVDTEKKSSNFDVLEKYGSKVFFILTPIFAFFLMKNFRKNKRYYVEHVIYTVHFHSFTFILLLVAALIDFASFHYISYPIDFVKYGILLWYVFKSLRIVYQRSKGVTIRKMVTLGILYSIAFGISTFSVEFIVNHLPAH